MTTDATNWVVKARFHGGGMGVYLMEAGTTRQRALAEVEKYLVQGAEVVTIEQPRIDAKIG